MAIRVDEAGGLVWYDNHEDIVRVINSTRISTWYPHGQIVRDLGQFSEGAAMQ